MTIDNGGNAFPEIYESIETGSGYDVMTRNGISVRDYFAAKAVQGQLAAARPNQPESITTLARVSFEIADAMIKARNVQ